MHRPNGRNSTRCSGSLPKNERSRPRKGGDRRIRARNGFLKARDKSPKIALCAIAYRQGPCLAALHPAKARRFEGFAPGSETLGTERNAWWRREDSNCVPGTQSYRTGLHEAIMSSLAPKLDIRRMGLDVRLVRIVLQKSTRNSWRAKSGNNRIRTDDFLNQHCAPMRNSKSMLLARTLKIVLQHNLR